MTALRKPDARPSPVRWTADEYLLVARRFFAIRAVSKLYMPEAADLAQQCLLPERHRPFMGDNKGLIHVAVPKFKAAFEPWALDNDELVKADRLAMVAELDGAEPAVEPEPPAPPPAAPMLESFDIPARPAPVPASMAPTPALGPLETALAGMVANAVGAEVGRLVEAVRQENQRNREEYQSLLAQQYDALMCYFDPEYKRRRELTAEYVHDHSLPPLLEQVRMRATRVLISCGESSMYNGVQMHFKGVEFTFVNATNLQKVSSGAFYDLVVCTRFTSHSAMAILRKHHGNKVVSIDGGISLLVGTIRKHLGL